MFKNYDLAKLKAKRDKNDITQFLKDNEGFIISVGKDYALRADEESDYLQEAYFAFMKALDSWSENSNYQFSGYFRMWLKCYLFKYRYSMGYPVKVNQYTYTKVCKDSVDLDELVSNSMASINDKPSFEECVEDKVLVNTIFVFVKSNFSTRDYLVFEMRYRYERSIKSIANQLGIDDSTVSRILSNCKKKLQKEFGCV